MDEVRAVARYNKITLTEDEIFQASYLAQKKVEEYREGFDHAIRATVREIAHLDCPEQFLDLSKDEIVSEICNAFDESGKCKLVQCGSEEVVLELDNGQIIKAKIELLKKFYFTFGSDEHFPYQNGYIIILAANMKKAQEIFRSHYPDRYPGCLNCAFFYDEMSWIDQYSDGPIKIIV